MTAQGEDLLAWLDNAITAREDAARAVGYDQIETVDYLWETKYLLLRRGDEAKASTELDATLADHIAANDPASVLRRCAADRKLIYEVRRTAENAKSRPWDPMYGPYADAMLAAAKVVAEGYGWTECER
ncbi:DUF6221 family protein [Streptomyces sp. NPDC059916]|uniref:DUF6221 family protein n=1 Tax=Streptomyces sp. NPDC059916 TaxID=3347001 RepID=UPI00369A251E